MPKTKSEENITPAEAIQILQSALSYCQRAGLKVILGNSLFKDKDCLMIQVDGVKSIETEGVFTLEPSPEPLSITNIPNPIDAEDKS